MKKVLLIAPHPDDETLGAGGTIRKFADAGHEVTVVTVAAHMPPLYPKEVHETTVTESFSALRNLFSSTGPRYCSATYRYPSSIHWSSTR